MFFLSFFYPSSVGKRVSSYSKKKIELIGGTELYEYLLFHIFTQTEASKRER